MELSSVNSTKLQSADQKLTVTKEDETVTPNKGDVALELDKKATTDSVTISAEAKIALNDDMAVTTYKSGGGVIRK